MKLIKIGSSPACDIVLQSEYVSGLHAEMTLLDNGEIVIVDKSSTNGTYVGTKRITPNQEVTVRRGDYIRFGNEDLVWARVPRIENLDKYKTVISIGTNFRNDIIVSSEVMSRFHASLRIDKKGKAFIHDNGSKNGTEVNGVKIQSGKDYRVKKGDIVVCGTEDITEQLKQYIPGGFPLWAMIASGVAGVAAVVAALMFILPDIFGKGCGMNVEKASSAVVYVRASFHFEVTVEDNPFTDPEYSKLLVKRTEGIPYQATAFFIDNEGRMATNRHVAMPWAEEYRPEGTTQTLREEYQKFLLKALNISSWQFEVIQPAILLQQLQQTELGQAILSESNSIAGVIAKIDAIKNSKILISGKLEDITVGYAGQYYTHEDQFQRCFVVASAQSGDQDIAILQLGDKKTPKDVKAVFCVKSMHEDDLVPQKDELYVVGYPYGIYWGQDDKSKSLEPNVKQTKCSKTPGKFDFEFQESSIGGSSGSPIFKKDGTLVGILSSGISGQTISMAVKAKYLKKLYEDEVGSVK